MWHYDALSPVLPRHFIVMILKKKIQLIWNKLISKGITFLTEKIVKLLYIFLWWSNLAMYKYLTAYRTGLKVYKKRKQKMWF